MRNQLCALLPKYLPSPHIEIFLTSVNITQLDNEKQSQLISVNWDTHHSEPSSET